MQLAYQGIPLGSPTTRRRPTPAAPSRARHGPGGLRALDGHAREASADETGVFLANHGHEALIAGAALVAGNAVRLDIRGTANHPHTLELSAEEIVAIAAGLRVGKESSEEKGHTHYVIFN